MAIPRTSHGGIVSESGLLLSGENEKSPLYNEIEEFLV